MIFLFKHPKCIILQGFIMMKKIKIFFLLFVALFPLISRGQMSFESFQQLTLDHGLSQSSVYSIIQDSKGYMWFGTQSGVNKYNGKTFQIILHDLTDTNSLSDNWIYSMLEDPKGNIWIATRSGLNRLDPNTNKIKRFVRKPRSKNTLPDSKIYSLILDKEGKIWLRTLYCLTKLDPATEKFTHYEFEIDPFSFFERDYGWPMYEDGKGYIWLGSFDGLRLFSIKDEIFTLLRNEPLNPKSISDNRVTTIIEDRFKNIWIGTRKGLNKFNRKTKTFTRFYHEQHNSKSIVNDDIITLLLDHEGMLWVGTSDGLSKYNYISGTFTNFVNDPNRHNSLTNNTITALYNDRSHNLWIGTDGGGLNKIDLKPKKFEIYNVFNGLSHNMIASIYEETKEKLWVGTWGGGLNVFNRITGDVEHFSERLEGNKKLVNDYVHVIFKDNRGYMWLGTRKGVMIYQPEKKQFISFSDFFKGDVKINSRVNSITQTKEGDIWIGSESGAFYLDFTSRESRGFFENPNDPNSISSNHVYTIKEDSDGDIWIATVKGLNKLSFMPFKAQKFLNDPGNLNSLSGNSVYAFLQDKEGFIWLATNCGLDMYDKRSNDFIYYTTKQGMPSDELYGLVEDNFGNIWVTTTRGLTCFNKKNKTFKNYDKDDGLQGLEFNLGANFKSPVDGEIYMGGISGFNAFYPERIKNNNNIPPILITKIIKKSNAGEIEIPFVDGSTIELTYQDYLLNIEFAALEFTNPEKNRYAYKIEGMSNQSVDWIDIGNRPNVSFSNMPAGNYIITIKGSNNDEVWNNTGVSIHVIVSPPFWKTLWAIILYIIVVASVLWYYISTRTKKLKEANQILREKQYAALEIAKQKEDLTRKNKAITDSINYAKRIQEAMMPSEFLFNKLLSDAFILFKPRDIVSGDFYWITERKNKIFIAAVDCTGHGVPGAFMSIIGYDLLKTITKEREIENPAEILNQLNEGVIDTFSKNVIDGDVKDGMDISLCVIDKNNRTMEYAGAINPLFIVRNNRLIEVRGNRYAVGSSDYDERMTYESHVIPLRDNDMVYMFSDGYADQFGGPAGKKYKFKRFRHFLQTISAYTLKDQKKYLEENINKWKGDLEQVDDILIIGIRITRSLS